MTLLEMLLAITLLALLTSAAWSWSAGMNRLGTSFTANRRAFQDVVACMDLLRDDIELAVVTDGSVLHRHGVQELTITTMHQVPGQTGRGLRPIIWRSSPTRGVQREDGASVRTLTTRASLQIRIEDHQSGLVWCDWTEIPEHPGSAVPAAWSLAIETP